MTNLWQDIRYALRQLRKSPGFTITAIVTLALGIGANTAIFSVVNAVLLRPLPYPDFNRLVVPEVFDAKGRPIFGAMYPDIREWQQRAHSFSGINYWTASKQFMDTPDGGESISNVQSGANLFSLLSVGPKLGRTYGFNEQTPGRDHVVVLSDSIWKKYFHRDPKALGKMIYLEGDIGYVGFLWLASLL